MNTRQRLVRPSAVPARVTGRPVFVDFTPTSEWRDGEDGSAILVINLPGFMREQIRVSAEPSGYLRVRGLRRVNNRNWSRFNKEFQVPEYCSMTGIRAKFENGTLWITIPNKNPPEAEQPKSTEMESSPPAPPLPPPSPPRQSEVQPVPPPMSTPSLPAQPLLLPSSSPKQSEPSPQPVPSATEYYTDEAEPEKTISTPRSDVKNMPLKSHDEAPQERSSPTNPDNNAQTVLTEGQESKKTSTLTTKTVEANEQLRKDHLDRRATETAAAISTKLSSGDLRLQDYMNFAKGKLIEDKQTLVNMGAAVLVIAGLGAYICYTIVGRD